MPEVASSTLEKLTAVDELNRTLDPLGVSEVHIAILIGGSNRPLSGHLQYKAMRGSNLLALLVIS